MRRETTHTPEGEVIHQRQFNSIDDVISFAKNVLNMSESQQQECASITGDERFTGTESLEQAVELCELGWPEGVQKAEDLIDRLDLDDPGNLGFSLDQMFDVAGDEPDIDRYLIGEPENMIEYSLDPTSQGRNIKLLCNISMPAYIAAETILRRGIIIASALGNITTAGYGVQLELIEKTSGYNYPNSETMEYRIPILQAGDYFNLDSLIFSLVHPSMLRRLIFAVNENEEPEIRNTFGFRYMGGYGTPESVGQNSEPNTVVVDKEHYLVSSDDKVAGAVTMLTEDILKVAKIKSNK